MPISFDQIPNGSKVPFMYAEFDSTNAVQGSQAQAYRALLIGQALASADLTDGDVIRVRNADEVGAWAGYHSTLHQMAIAWYAKNKYTELWVGAYKDDALATEPTVKIAFSGTATEAGAVNLLIAGYPIKVYVDEGDDADALCSAIASAIGDLSGKVPFTASTDAANDAIDIDMVESGVHLNDCNVFINYYDDQKMPAGLFVDASTHNTNGLFSSATISDFYFDQFSTGTGTHDVTTLFANVPDQQFHIIAGAFTDSTALAAIKTELATRSEAGNEIEGLYFFAEQGAGSSTRDENSEHLVGIANDYNVRPGYCLAAETAAMVAFHGQIDPARPFQNLAYSHCLPAPAGWRATRLEREQFLADGWATVKVDGGGTLLIERLITTYKTNNAGADDPAYLDINTLLTLSYIRWDWTNTLALKYPRHKVADDGARFGPGQAIVTPKGIRAEAMAKFRDWEYAGLVENFEQFKADLIVERNAQDPNRIDVLLPPDLVNQLRITGTKIGFILQSAPSYDGASAAVPE